MTPETETARSSWGPARPLGAYLLLFGAIYAGWGVLSPFLPAVLARQGASAEQVGLLLALALVVRLIAAPAWGLVADRSPAPRRVLGWLLLAAAMLALAYGHAGGFAGLLLVSAPHALAIGPIGPLPDALAISAAGAPGRERFSYGWVRGAGAAGFIAGSAFSGWAVSSAGAPEIVLRLNAALFASAAAIAMLLLPPSRDPPGTDAVPPDRNLTPPGGIPALLRLPSFRWLLLASGLIAGSHALYAGFATLHWEAGELTPAAIGLLWSMAVGAEVIVFFLLGPWLLARLGPAYLTALAAGAGVLRWSVMATTTSLPVLLITQPLHGLTFAAQHLAAMAILARVVPPHLGATAQTLYGSLGTGAATAALTLVSGYLYAGWHGQGFWLMALLCGAALPAALMLRSHVPPAAGPS